jgi:hypothetical protein
MEHVADGAVGRLLVEEIGQDAIVEESQGCGENLGGEATALLFAGAESLSGFFEKDLNGPP